MRVLLVEDDRMLAQEIAQALRHENFAVDIASNGEDGQHLGETENYDATLARPKTTTRRSSIWVCRK
jgi:two-component system OmpR family response regulator